MLNQSRVAQSEVKMAAIPAREALFTHIAVADKVAKNHPSLKNNQRAKQPRLY